MVLAAGICLLGAGCIWMPDSRQATIDPAPWLSSGPGSKAATGAIKKQVEGARAELKKLGTPPRPIVLIAKIIRPSVVLVAH